MSEPTRHTPRTIEDLLAVSKKLAERAAEASRELSEIAAEMNATRREIEQRMKEHEQSFN